MKLTAVLFIFTLTSCAQHPKSPDAWLNKNLVVMEEDNPYNFEAIGNAVGDARIIALGESSHGLAEFFTFKSELIRYLHKEKGFEVLAMEGGLGDINLAYSNIDTLSRDQLKKNTLFPNFRPKEIDALMETFYTSKETATPLLYTGFDTQISSSYTLRFLEKVVAAYDPGLSAEILPVLGAQYVIAQKAGEQDSTEYYRVRNKFMEVSAKTEAVLFTHKNEIGSTYHLTDFQFKILKRTLEMFRKSVHLSYEDNYRSYELRDQLMVENLEWLLSEVYPDKKIIIWAHNAHIENGTSEGYTFKMMGHYVKEKHKEDYYALGLFAYKGEAYKQWTNSTETFENNDISFIENKLINGQQLNTFLDIQHLENTPNTMWLFEPINGLELENGGIISFIPKKRFDGIITVYESAAPTFKR